MKNKFLFILITVTLVYQSAQAQTDFCELMDKAILSACKGDTVATIKNLYKLSAEHPNHELADDIVVQIAYLHQNMGQYDKAVAVCKDILKGKYLREIDDEYEYCPSITSHKESCREHIVYNADYQANQHYASSTLSNIYAKKQQHDSTLYYLTLTENVYPYYGGCGNGYVAYRKRMRLKYSELYEAQGNIHEAIQVLIPFLFAKGISSNEKIESRFIDLLKENNLYTQASTEFLNAIENIEIERVLYETDDEWISDDEGVIQEMIISRKYVKHGVFTFRNVKLYLPDIEDFKYAKVAEEQKRKKRVSWKKVNNYQPTDEEYLAFLKQYVSNSSIYKKLIQ